MEVTQPFSADQLHVSNVIAMMRRSSEQSTIVKNSYKLYKCHIFQIILTQFRALRTRLGTSCLEIKRKINFNSIRCELFRRSDGLASILVSAERAE